jgi:MoaA/NifB/PqqE/SkfB family radical SAM enzyme
MADTAKEKRLPILEDTLRMVAWEITRRCNLACIHCRASSERGPYPDELTTDEGLRLLDEIASFSSPVIILTGGEPLLREDVYDLAAYGTKKGLRMVLATNGTLVTEAVARRMIEAGIQRVSISLDGADAGSHDAFRGVPGAFAGAMAGIAAMKRVGLEFQIKPRSPGRTGRDCADPRSRRPDRGGGPSYLPSGPHRAGAGDGRPVHLGGGVRGNPAVVRR